MLQIHQIEQSLRKQSKLVKNQQVDGRDMHGLLQINRKNGIENKAKPRPPQPTLRASHPDSHHMPQIIRSSNPFASTQNMFIKIQ